MTHRQYEPGIYVVRLNTGCTGLASYDGADRWYIFGMDWPDIPGEVLAGPIPISRIAAANEMYEALRTGLETLQHQYLYRVSGDPDTLPIQKLLEAALRKADGKD